MLYSNRLYFILLSFSDTTTSSAVRCSINNNKINFKTIDKNAKNFEGTLNLKEIKWTISQKKSIQDIHNIGDIFFVAKKNNNWEIKQYPKVNGGIVAFVNL